MKKQLIFGFAIIFTFLFVLFFFVASKELRQSNRQEQQGAYSPESQGGGGMYMPNQDYSPMSNNAQQQQYNQSYTQGYQQQYIQAPPVDYNQQAYAGQQYTSYPPSNGRAKASSIFTINFPFDRAAPSKNALNQAMTKINQQAEAIMASPNTSIIIEGHTDARGTQEYNMALGYRRAAWTQKQLESAGVSADRIRTVSFGKERPIAGGNTEAAYAKNRRTETHLD